MGHPLYTKEEIVQKGKELYEKQIRREVEDGNTGKALVINIENGEYELDEDHLEASRRAHEKTPDGAFFAMRIGYPTMGRIGGKLMGKSGRFADMSARTERRAFDCG